MTIPPAGVSGPDRQKRSQHTGNVPPAGQRSVISFYFIRAASSLATSGDSSTMA